MVAFILTMIFISASLLIYTLLVVSGKKFNPERKKLKELLSEARPAAATGGGDNLSIIVREKDGPNPAIQKVLERLYTFLPAAGKQSKYHDQLLSQAGYIGEKPYKIYKTVKTLAALSLFLLSFYMTFVLNFPTAKIMIVSGLLCLVGYILPDYYLIIKARQRRSMIRSALPDALDLLVITVEAGLSINAAIFKVGEELRMRSKPLSDELLRVHQDLRTGRSREQALKDLAKRNDIEDLKIFVGALVIADRLGTSVASTLRAQSDSLRTRVRQRSEEKAAKASLKMLFPLVFFILPTLFIILLGPGVIRVIDVLGPGLGK